MGGKTHGMIGRGTGIGEREVAEATGKTEECQGVTLGVTIMIVHRGGTEISLRAAWTEDQVRAAVEDPQEAIVTNLQCKWEAETGKRAPALHQKRRNLHLI